MPVAIKPEPTPEPQVWCIVKQTSPKIEAVPPINQQLIVAKRWADFESDQEIEEESNDTRTEKATGSFDIHVSQHSLRCSTKIRLLNHVTRQKRSRSVQKTKVIAQNRKAREEGDKINQKDINFFKAIQDIRKRDSLINKMKEDFVAAVKATAQYKAKLSERKSKSGSVVHKPISQPQSKDPQIALPNGQPEQKMSPVMLKPAQEVTKAEPAVVQPVSNPVIQPKTKVQDPKPMVVTPSGPQTIKPVNADPKNKNENPAQKPAIVKTDKIEKTAFNSKVFDIPS